MIDWQELLDIRRIRGELGLSQTQLADLIGVSPRTIQSCEQGWRRPSSALEKAVLLLLLASRNGPGFGQQKCWDTKHCLASGGDNCMVYRSGQGHICWLLSGNICGGRRLRNWADKKEVCGDCAFLRGLVEPQSET